MHSIICIIFLLFLSPNCFGSLGFNDDQPQVPCLYIFGDSLYDNGNNNNLETLAKVNYPPYGIDFPGSISTGRFSNGLTMVDVIAKLLGFKQFIPSFADAITGTDATKGVNYASGASGIRYETSYLLGEVIPLPDQVRNHLSIVSQAGAKDYLKKCLYMVNIGSNDYLSNYYAPVGYITQQVLTPEQYATELVLEYSNQIKVLYANGARKMALSGLGLLGCALGEVIIYGASNGSGCADRINNAAESFNSKLISLVDELNSNFTDAKFVYLNTTALVPTEDPKALDGTCCELGLNGLCKPYSSPCQNRSEYFFWDSFHPTEAVNVIAAERAYSGLDPRIASPMGISQLANLQLPDNER